MKYHVKKNEPTARELKREAFRELADEVIEVLMTYIVLGGLILTPIAIVYAMIHFGIEMLLK